MPACVWLALGFIVLLTVVTVVGRFSMRRIAAARAGESFETFRDAFAMEPVPADVLRGVYAKFQECASGFGGTGFPVRADDVIDHVYGMVDEDLDDALEEVISECGRRIPPEEQLRRMEPVVTVRDFARFVAACPATADRVAGPR